LGIIFAGVSYDIIQENIMPWVCNKNDVSKFLSGMTSILESGDEDTSLYIVKETKPDDKTYKFMVEHNITRRVIYEELLKLDITNYSYTDYDDNPRFTGEQIWVFGQMFGTYEVYIKLKLRGKVVCLSFHEKEFDLKYPYLNG